MIAYNSVCLGNLFIKNQAEEAYNQGCINRDELTFIKNKYPVLFYSPNLFIRVGLFIITTIILLFSFGIFLLIFLDSADHFIGGLAIFFAIFSYVLLEYIISTKKNYQSGIDDALLFISAIALFGGISSLTNAGGIANCVLIFIISLYSSLRFADRLMSVLCIISFLGIFFLFLSKAGSAASVFIPFVLMAISAIIYFVSKRIKLSNSNWAYKNCLLIVSITCLLCFYFSGNYYIVKELSKTLFNLNGTQHGVVTFGWFFWACTFIIPLIYLQRGIQKKDIILIRIGLLLVAAIFLTVRYYYFMVPIEMVIAVAGIILMLSSYIITRYLKTPKYGFVNKETVSKDNDGKLQIESLLLAQTLSSQQASSEGLKFRGGDFGGGGSGSDY